MIIIRTTITVYFKYCIRFFKIFQTNNTFCCTIINFTVLYLAQKKINKPRKNFFQKMSEDEAAEVRVEVVKAIGIKAIVIIRNEEQAQIISLLQKMSEDESDNVRVAVARSAASITNSEAKLLLRSMCLEERNFLVFPPVVFSKLCRKWTPTKILQEVLL